MAVGRVPQQRVARHQQPVPDPTQRRGAPPIDAADREGIQRHLAVVEPDGEMIVFNRDRCPAGPNSCTTTQLWKMRADGSHARKLGSGSPGAYLPDWGVEPR